MTQQAAFQVLQRATGYDFLLAENDIYDDFYPGIQATFAQLDDLRRVIYVGNFSKSISASLRLGFVAYPGIWLSR